MRKIILLLLLLISVHTSWVWADNIKFGIFPSNDPAKLIRVMDVLGNYLQETTGEQLEMIVTRDYDELLERLKNHSLDFAWINTLNYIRAKAALPSIRYVTTYVEKNTSTGTIRPYYQSYIVTLADNSISTMEQARNTRFAFTDPGSTSGYAYPKRLLHDMGIEPAEYFKKVFFLKRHDRVAQALFSGAIDVGAMSDGTYYTNQTQDGKQLTILAQSAPIPLGAIVANTHLAKEKVELYRRVLTAMPSNHAFCQAMQSIIGWPAAGFTSRNDAFYDSARTALQ